MTGERDPLTQLVIGAAIEVHRHLGPGLIESVYQTCMKKELEALGIPFKDYEPAPVKYKGEFVGQNLIMDFYFPSRLVVELKAVTTIHPIYKAQLLTYLRMTNTRVGLLINFNVELLKEGIVRMVL